MQELKKMGVLSVAKIYAAFGAIGGFLLGVFMTLIGAAAIGGLSGLYFGVASIIIFPILYAILGFVGGAIFAFLYNLIAGWIGGIEIELV
jgi:hypothetical protein